MRRKSGSSRCRVVAADGVTHAQTRRAMRRLLAERDGAACFYCRTPVEDPATQLTFDHYVPACVLPVSELWNLVLACEPCNQAKADAIPWPVVWLLLSITKACATPMQEAA